MKNSPESSGLVCHLFRRHYWSWPPRPDSPVCCCRRRVRHTGRTPPARSIGSPSHPLDSGRSAVFSEPDHPVIRDRMREAFAEAVIRLGCTQGNGVGSAWGHNGRTLGAPVTSQLGKAWLRLLEAPADKRGGKLWDGTEQA